MDYNYNISLDLNATNSIPAICAKQGDNSRTVTVTLLKDGIVYAPPAGCSASYRIRGIENVATIQQDGTIYFLLTSGALSIPGRATCDIVLTVLGQILSTTNFVIDIQPIPSAIEDENYQYELVTKENQFRYGVMPPAGSEWAGKIVEYIGASTSQFIRGYFYECSQSGGVYSWNNINVSSGGGSGSGSVWGQITGNLSNQSDLNNALNNKISLPSAAISTGYVYKANGSGGGSWQPESGGGSGVWGQITGTLSNQTDLNSALNSKISVPSAQVSAGYVYKANGMGGGSWQPESGGGSGGGGTWGSITGNLSDQADLYVALSSKQPSIAQGTSAPPNPSLGDYWDSPQNEFIISSTIDTVLSSISTNPVENRAIYEGLQEKISNPAGGSAGAVLARTSDGIAWSSEIGGTVILRGTIVETEDGITVNGITYSQIMAANVSGKTVVLRLTLEGLGPILFTLQCKDQYGDFQFISIMTSPGSYSYNDYLKVDSSNSWYLKQLRVPVSASLGSSTSVIPNAYMVYNALSSKISMPSGGSTGNVLTKTSDGVTWSSGGGGGTWGSITGTLSNQTDLNTALLNKQKIIVQTSSAPSNPSTGDYWDDPNDTAIIAAIDSSITSQSPNPVQGNAIYAALSSKISYPSGGSVGNVLKKTADGVEWGEGGSGGGGTWGSITGTLSSQTDLQTALNSKISMPTGGYNGYFLSKTSSGVSWEAAPQSYPEDIITVVECAISSLGVVTSSAIFEDVFLDAQNGKEIICKCQIEDYMPVLWMPLVSSENPYSNARSPEPFVFNGLYINDNDEIIRIILKFEWNNTWTFQSTSYEQNSNKVTSLSSISTDTQYPSAKCVYDNLSTKIAEPTNGSTGQVLTKTSDGVAWSSVSGFQPSTTSVTLSSAAWTSGSQTVSAIGVTSSNIVAVSPQPSSLIKFEQAKVMVTGQSSGQLTFECISDPDVDIGVNVLILGV